MRFAFILFTIACGSVEGEWEGECEDVSTGEVREFDIELSGSGNDVDGEAYMITTSPTGGEKTTHSCDVEGDSTLSTMTLSFTCDNGEEFSIAFDKDGKQWVGYCRTDDENSELRLTAD